MSWECANLDASILLLLELTNTWSKNCCTDQGTNTTNHVDTVGTGEIVEAPLRQPAAAPYPVSDYRIYERRHADADYDVRVKLESLCHCTGYDSSRSRTEHSLEQKIDMRRQAAVQRLPNL